MKCFVFRYPKNVVTDVLLCLICVFLIVLILQKGETVSVSSFDNIESEDRIAFLYAYGWKIDPHSEQFATVILPEVFDETWKEYNLLQKQQGFDLLPYAGKEIIRYTYEFVDFPGIDDSSGIFASVYAYDGKIIASDIYSVAFDGFMQGVR